MSQFLMSPGVSIREIDQSQYAATGAATGNVVALVGYAEKGSFEPTYCYGQEDFINKFGKTLADVPYLAQAAYKYFDDGKVLLVVRAGDDRDPDVYPNAAKAASKTIRVNPSEVSAKAGYQTFKATSSVIPTPNLNYTFKVLADHRGFKTPKYLEKWSAVLDETYNEMGVPSPAGTVLDAVIKIACDAQTSSSFIVNHKRDLSSGSTQEYYGTGTRSGMAHGDSVQATVYKYFQNDTYGEDDSDWVKIQGAYGAALVGTANLKAGFDWENTAQSFQIGIGSTTYTVTLNVATTDIDEAVVALGNAFKTAINDDTSSETDISDLFTVMKIVPTPTSAYLALILKTDTAGTGFEILAGGTALLTLGFAPGEYLPGNSIHGVWNAQTIESNVAKAWSGNFVFKKESYTNNAISFQDTVEVSVTAPATGPWTLGALATAIQTKLDQAFTAYNYPKSRAHVFVDSSSNKIKVATLSDVTSEFASIVRITAGTSNDLVSLLGGTDAAVDGVPISSVGEVKIVLSAAEKGTYGNKLALKTETQIVKLGSTTQTYYNVYVLYDGKAVSSYYKVNWTDDTQPNFILNRIADDAYLNFVAVDEDDNTVLARLPDGIWTLGNGDLPSGVTSDMAEIAEFVSGTNGWTESGGAITTMTSDFENALEKISNPEVFEFHIVAAPGDASPSMQNAIQSFCDGRRDCIGVVDAAPFGLGLGIGNKTRVITEVNDACSTLNSSYVSAFWPWVLDKDSDNNQYVWLPPSIYAIKAMVYTDSVSDPWYAPAGLTRGKVSALDVEYSAREIDRDILYGDTAVVNPIVKFVNEGITIWGQKTTQRTLTATNRINVRRLMIYAEKLIAKMARGFLFEPNDEANWSAFARQANAILEPIRQRRGLYSFSVVCDSSTNTNALVDQNLMAGKIFLQPTKTIEGIFVDFTITATGAVLITEA